MEYWLSQNRRIEWPRVPRVPRVTYEYISRPKRCLQMEMLDDYPIDSHILEVIKNDGKHQAALSSKAVALRKYINDCRESDEQNRITRFNHIEQMRLMANLEDGAEGIMMQALTQHNVQITKVEPCQYYFEIRNEELLENLDKSFIDGKISDLMIQPIIIGDYRGRRTPIQRNTSGSIRRISGGKLHFRTEGPLKLNKDFRFTIIFEQNRITHQMKQFALDIVNGAGIMNFLFPSSISSEPSPQPENFHCIGESLNPEQKLAVTGALAKSEVPFLIFGPPGTGKTKTMVEAIGQIISSSDQKVLVCANSNSVCDEIASRLIKLKMDASILRMYSTKMKKKNIPKDLLRYSNYDEAAKALSLPELFKLKKNRVIICTLFMSGRLAQGKIPSNHFSYIFIDECASVPEPDALTAIAVAAKSKAVHAKVVLVGDPLQLRGVVQSRLAQKMGYDISLMERLMYLPAYKKNGTANKFNSRYVVQLTRNYRSHTAILQPSNELFYDKTLKASAKPAITNLYTGTVLLPSPNFPIIFKSIQGQCKRDGSSLNNNTELNIVISYVEQLLDGKIQGPYKRPNKKGRKGTKKPSETSENEFRKAKLSEIGLISPYKSQCRHLKGACKKRGWDDIKIGSLEIFQGQERPIIIVSTVRSQMNSIGFLDNFRRLNVLLTRAKCLMIIIGDPFTLRLDENWRHVMNYILKNKGFIQSNRQYSANEEENQIELALNQMHL